MKDFRTLPRILSESGYACGLSGKWHLGDNLKPQDGFSYWFAKAGGNTTTFYNDQMIWEGRTYPEPRYTTEVITDHALEFLERSRKTPFFLYLAYNAPYGLGEVVREAHRNSHTADYADKEMSWDNVIFHDFENTRMIRTPEWKLTLRHPYGPDELYHMTTDPDERENLIHVGEHTAIRRQLTDQLRAFFSKYADPKYDRWQGGACKGSRLL